MSLHNSKVTSKPGREKSQELLLQMFIYPLTPLGSKEIWPDTAGAGLVLGKEMVKSNTSKNVDIYITQGKHTVLLCTHICLHLKQRL